MAASQMSFQHSSPVSSIEVTDALDHRCHQDVANSVAVDSGTSSESDSCNSCTLCMAFAFSSSHFSIAADPYSETFKRSNFSFESHDARALTKPPIL